MEATGYLNWNVWYVCMHIYVTDDGSYRTSQLECMVCMYVYIYIYICNRRWKLPDISIGMYGMYVCIYIYIYIYVTDDGSYRTSQLECMVCMYVYIYIYIYM